MSSEIKAVAFDLDGTLINSATGLTGAIDLMLKTLGYPIAGFDKVSVWVGNGAASLVETALKDAAGEAGFTKFEEGFTLFNRFYVEVLKKGSELYPNVRETLNTLKKEGYQLALITNKPTEFLPDILNDLGFTDLFDLVLGADDVAMRKPHPAPIFQTLGFLGLYQRELIFIGDSRNDIESAKSAGVITVGLTYGYNFGRLIAEENPTYVIDDFAEILTIVKRD